MECGTCGAKHEGGKCPRCYPERVAPMVAPEEPKATEKPKTKKKGIWNNFKPETL